MIIPEIELWQKSNCGIWASLDGMAAHISLGPTDIWVNLMSCQSILARSEFACIFVKSADVKVLATRYLHGDIAHVGVGGSPLVGREITFPELPLDLGDGLIVEIGN